MSIVADLRSITPEELARCLEDPGRVVELLQCREARPAVVHSCFLEKSQFAIHFLLAGDVWDEQSRYAAAIFGCHEIGPMLPAGPIMYLTPEEVRLVAADLSAVGRTEMADRFSTERLTEAGVYPNHWIEDACSITRVLDDYDALVAFYTRAAGSGEAVILHIG